MSLSKDLDQDVGPFQYVICSKECCRGAILSEETDKCEAVRNHTRHLKPHFAMAIVVGETVNYPVYTNLLP